MSVLSSGDFQRYVESCTQALDGAAARLLALRTAVSESYVEAKIRSAQAIERFAEHVRTHAALYSSEWNLTLATATAAARARLESELAGTRARIKALVSELTSLEDQQRSDRDAMDRENPKLDRREEAIKAELEPQLAELQRIYRQLERKRSFFAFIGAPFETKRLAARYRELQEEAESRRLDLENVRAEWQRHLAEHGNANDERQGAWQDKMVAISSLRTRERFLETKLDDAAHLAAVSQLVSDEQHLQLFQSERKRIDDPAAAELLAELDRCAVDVDLNHSALEITSRAFGMIGALGKGFRAFSDSVRNVIAQETTYSQLSALTIVPSELVLGFSPLVLQLTDELSGLGEKPNPSDLLRLLEPRLAIELTEESVTRLFEEMGNALRDACAAWG